MVVAKKAKLSKREKQARGMMVAALLKGKKLQMPMCNGSISTIPVSVRLTGWYIELKAKWPGAGDDYGSVTAWSIDPSGKKTKLGVVDADLHLDALPAGVSMDLLGWLNEISEAVVDAMMKS